MSNAESSGARGGPRVLVIFPGALGDLLCFAPALRALARRHAPSALELMARRELARLAVGRLSVERGHSIDRREAGLLFSEAPDAAAGAGEFFACFSRVYCFLGAANLTCRRVLAEACAGEVSFHPFLRADSTHSGEHVALGYLRSLGAEASPLDGHIDLGEKDLGAAARVLAHHRLSPGEFLLMLAGSGSPNKNWPAKRFAELARLLPGGRRAAVLLGPAESGLGEFFRAQGLSVVEGLELEVAAALARLALRFVGNDSGISKLAAAAGAPGVVLFGPTDARRWRPLGEVEVLARQPLEELQATEVAQALADRGFG